LRERQRSARTTGVAMRRSPVAQDFVAASE
jgi:hypothetical protein